MRDFARESSVIFPSQAKCDYFNFGSSGTIHFVDSLCLLPQNVANEKIFVFLYFWMIVLVTFCILHFISILIKLQHNFKKDDSFGYSLVLGIMKKNLSPCLVDDLLEARKRDTNKNEE